MNREDMDRKNRRAREMRAERKELKKAQQEQQKQQELPPDYDSPDNEVVDEINQDVDTNIPKEITYEEKEEIRRKAIAEKRRASLALARTKIKSRSSIRQEANTEIEKIREENDKLKKDAEIQKCILEEQRLKPTIIKKYMRPKRESQPQPVPISQPDPSINYLAEQSYAEQLQIKLRENMINKIMMDTFM